VYLFYGLENLSLNVGGIFMAALQIFERRALRKISDVIGEELEGRLKY